VSMPPSTIAPGAAPGLSPMARRWIATGLAVGTVLYIVPSALHGNPPIESAELTLRYVAERPSWRLVHLLNIAAVLIWAVSLGALGSRLTGTAPTIGRAAGIVLTATTAVFAIYFSIHAMALPVAAERFASGTGEPSQILTQTESVLLVLGATAFIAQAMLGLAVLLYGLAVATSDRLPTWLGWLGALGGGGWLAGAVLIDFAVIVPFTVVSWAWMLVLAMALLRATGTKTNA
jgi:hypothetical protein